MNTLNRLSIEEASRLLAAREISSAELTEACLAEIERSDGKVGSFLQVTSDLAREQAADAEKRLVSATDVGPLTGVPIALKDLFITEGVRTTCASKLLANYVPAYQGSVARRLEEAGAVLLGKTNMDEFAMGSSTETSAFRVTHNPWNLDRVPGGSSGGSAAAVAARMVPLALGSDTGGSIRLPASFCGVVGTKPTYGRVSRYGLVAFASSLDQIGTVATDVEGAAALLEVISGHDPRDSTSIVAPVPDYPGELARPAKTLRLGVPREYFGEGLEPGVADAVGQALEVYRGCGAELVDISLPHTQYAVAAYYIIATAEASSNLARYDGVHYGYRAPGNLEIIRMVSRSRAEGFGREVKRRVMLGTYVLSAGYYDAYYLKALKVRRLIKQDFDEAFTRVDAVLCPTSPTAAFVLGEEADPLSMYLRDIFTISANLAGIPGIAVPCGFDSRGMPVGLQVLSDRKSVV